MRMVFIDNLKPRMMLAQDAYAPEGGYIPLVRKHVLLDQERIDKMKQRGVRFVYILEKGDKPATIAATAVNSRQVYVPKAKPIISPQLQKQALVNLQNIFSGISELKGDVHGSSSHIIKQVDMVVGQLVSSMEQNRSALVNINDLKSYDEYTYHHSLSVAVMSLAIAQQMGLSGKELHRLGVCAMMHDIGKTGVPIDILNKTARLTDEEFGVIKTHSSKGAEYLTHTDIQDEDIWRGVCCHHEKYDGTGYPYGLSKEEIPEWSRIISVADVYDALTSNRPYRQPASPAETVEYIMGGIGTSFDYDVVSAFIQKVELYPVGSIIELSNQKTAVVLNNENTMRPVVRLTDTGEIYDLYHDRSCLSVVVMRLVSDEKPSGV